MPFKVPLKPLPGISNTITKAFTLCFKGEGSFKDAMLKGKSPLKEVFLREACCHCCNTYTGNRTTLLKGLLVLTE